MERHSLKALLSVALLIVLAWLGIAVFAGHGAGRVVLIVIWAIALAAVASVAVWSLAQARRARMERRPEGTVRPK